MAMVCFQCGRQNDDGATLCNGCGASLVAPAEPAQPEPQHDEPREPVRLPRDRQDDALDLLTAAFIDDPLIRYVAGGGNRDHVARYVLDTLLRHGLRPLGLA